MTILAVAAGPQELGDLQRYTLLVATDGDQVRAAQRLRHEVFADELGATLHSSEPGLDVDRFDEFCDHLIIREELTGAVVGTYRMLPPGRAAEAGGLYAETEFDLAGLAPLRGDLVETGRSCVHPDHRSGAVINLMWAGIARYMHLHGHRWLGGCASVPLADGGATALGVWDLVERKHLVPQAWRVRPRNPWVAPESLAPPAKIDVPPLLRGYLRLGSWVGGAPAHDADFDCADFYVLLSLDRVNPRYLRHFLGQG
ncbi:GNAT family N-acetyltransferase [Dactylosporangium fulvum]|uniref:GNAT family N-acetyltransferase n=1 Tax=Dactylosporangium fulvum TaxID=53359 RepID=A0ABY5W2Z6_9ACTN|nr:GNAT family N-acyltransferase [Dactylosporangium fulvum]UWP83814.1 GNAT family N-acetyltransferase [Dactylosporangium fulvum]